MNTQAAGFLHYYAREGLAQQVLRVCNELIKADSGSPVLLFWRAYGLLASGAAAEVGGLHHMTTAARPSATAGAAGTKAQRHTHADHSARLTVQATRELFALQQHHDVGPAATAALLSAHQSAKVVDHHAVAQLTTRLEVRCHVQAVSTCVLLCACAQLTSPGGARAFGGGAWV